MRGSGVSSLGLECSFYIKPHSSPIGTYHNALILGECKIKISNVYKMSVTQSLCIILVNLQTMLSGCKKLGSSKALGDTHKMNALYRAKK
jgi:hypothetical protein